MSRTLKIVVLSSALAFAAAGSSHAQSPLDRAKSLLGRPTTDEKPTESQAGDGMKEALAQGAKNAVSQLGQLDGFLADELVRIVVPDSLQTIASTARKVGAGAKVDAFETAMNRAAEQAVPAAAGILSDAVRAMSVQDALSIVSGGETAGTDYFRRASGEDLPAAFLPIVKESTDSNQVSQSVKAMTSQGSSLFGGLAGLFGKEPAADLDLDEYVTDKTLDGLFHYIAEEEKSIRSNPLKRGSDLLKLVFGG